MNHRVFDDMVFTSDNWYMAQNFTVEATDDDVILESPYGSFLKVFVPDGVNTTENITLLVKEEDIGTASYFTIRHQS